jgi:uncharacterized protein with HEPN domain
MQLESRKLLQDVKKALELLLQFGNGKMLADYKGDAMLRAADQREFEIVGEALKLSHRPRSANLLPSRGA